MDLLKFTEDMKKIQTFIFHEYEQLNYNYQ